jgi:hypothetical protein
MTSGDFLLQIQATSGGDVELPALGSIDGGNTQIDVDGTASTLNVSTLASFSASTTSAPAFLSSLTVSNHGRLEDTALTTLNRVNLTLDGTGSVSLSQIGTYDAGVFTQTGGTATLGGLTNADGSLFVVSGGAAVSVPNLAAYASAPGVDGGFQATGTNTALSLAGLTTVSVDTTTSNSLVQIQAASGGNVELPSLKTVSGGAAEVMTDGAGSALDVSLLSSFTRNTDFAVVSEVVVTHGGTLKDPALTILNGVDIMLDGTGTVPLNQIARLNNGAVSLSGGAVTLGGLTNADGSSFGVTGGAMLSVPNLATLGGQVNGHFGILSSDPGSLLLLGDLTTIAIETMTPFAYYDITANSGGDIELPALANISGGPTQLLVDGQHSKIDVPLLANDSSDAAQSSSQGIIVTNGGTLIDPALTTISGVNLTVDGTGTISLNQIVAFTKGYISVDGTVEMGGLTDADGASFLVGLNSTLSVPALVTYTNAIGFTALFQTIGPNSVLSLPALEAINADTTDFNSFIQVNALDGGTILLPHLATISGGPVQLESDLPGSELDVPSLASFHGSSGQRGTSTILMTRGGNLIAPHLSITGVNLVGDADGTFTLSSTLGLTVEGGSSLIQVGTLSDQSHLILQNDATVNLEGAFSVSGSGVLATAPASTFIVAGNFLGTTQNADGFNPRGTIVLDSATGTTKPPQLLEVMSADRGAVQSAFFNNFAFGTLSVTPGTLVQLVDQSHNAASTEPEAVYVNKLIVQTYATLDLYMSHVYARTVQVPGTVSGTVNRNTVMPGDFDGDGIADPAVYDPLTSTFYIARSKLGNESFQFGTGTRFGGHPLNVSASYEGNGITDAAVFEPSTSTFYIHTSSGNKAIQFGIGTLYGGHPIPVPGDYEGDGIIDPAVFEPSTSTFYIARHNVSNEAIQFGIGTLYGGHPVPVPNNYEGDGKIDPAVFEPSTSTFYIARHNHPNAMIQFGIGTLYGGQPTPVPGNYEGDSQTDPAVFEPSTSTFYIARHNSPNEAVQFGIGTLYGGHPVVVASAYEGDGQTDPAVFEPSTSTYDIARHSAPNQAVQVGLGLLNGGHPVAVPAQYEGNGIVDPATFEPSTSTFSILRQNAPIESVQFGIGTLYGGHPQPITSPVTPASQGGPSVPSYEVVVASSLPTPTSPSPISVHDVALQHVQSSRTRPRFVTLASVPERRLNTPNLRNTAARPAPAENHSTAGNSGSSPSSRRSARSAGLSSRTL